MGISSDQLKKFKEIYKKEFGKEISDEDAMESAIKLVEMVRLVYKPIKKSDYEEYCKQKNVKH